VTRLGRNRLRTTALLLALPIAVLTGPAAVSAEAAPLTTWNRLAQCESSGRWQINTGNGYYGGLQISGSTWRAYGGRQFAALPDNATKTEQIKVGERIRAGQGWRAWGYCAHRIGLY
jgi:hypothetical protein